MSSELTDLGTTPLRYPRHAIPSSPPIRQHTLHLPNVHSTRSATSIYRDSDTECESDGAEDREQGARRIPPGYENSDGLHDDDDDDDDDDDGYDEYDDGDEDIENESNGEDRQQTETPIEIPRSMNNLGRKRAATRTVSPAQEQPAKRRQATTIYRRRVSIRDVEEIQKHLKARNASIKSFLREIMENPYHTGCRRALKEVLLEREHKCMNEWAIQYLTQLKWKPLIKELRSELGRFCKMFLQGKDILQLDPTSSTIPSQQWLERMMCESSVTKIAPTWTCLLLGSTEKYRMSSTLKKQSFSWCGGVLAQLGFRLQPRKNSKMARSLGMFLHSCNLTRKGMEILSSLGIVSSYWSINKQITDVMKVHKAVVHRLGHSKQRIIVYDNFNVSDRVREKRVGDESVMWNVTTGLLKISPLIPRMGIPQSWYRPTHPLTIRDLDPIDAQVRRSNHLLDTRLWHHYIFRAISVCFPQIENQSQLGSSITVDLPQLQRPLRHETSKIISLGPLMHDESTETGNAEISENIHERQFGLEPTDEQFSENIFLHFGDVMTTSRIHSLKQNRSVCETAYGKMDWVLPIFGLWHLRLNMQRLLIKYHFGGEHDDHASLWYAWHSAYTSRAFNDKIFDQCHHLITQSFQARLVAVMRHHVTEAYSETWTSPCNTQNNRQSDVRNSVTPTPARQSNGSGRATSVGSDVTDTDACSFSPWNQEHMQEWLYNQNWSTITSIIKHVRHHTDVYRRIAEERKRGDQGVGDTGRPQIVNEPQHDDEFRNHLHFLQNAFPYMILTDAIQTSDIGLLRHAIRHALLIFAGSSENYVYTRELCYYHWLTNTGACTQTLQEIILKESLVNRQGTSTSYYEMDRANELLNLYLRIVKVGKRTSSVPAKVLMERYTRLYSYTDRLQSMWETATGSTINTKHAYKNYASHLWLLATNLLTSDNQRPATIVEIPQGRGTLSVTPLLALQGKESLSTIVVEFNKWRSNLDLGEVDETGTRVDSTTIQQSAAFQRHLMALNQNRTTANNTADGTHTTSNSEPLPDSGVGDLDPDGENDEDVHAGVQIDNDYGDDFYIDLPIPPGDEALDESETYNDADLDELFATVDLDDWSQYSHYVNTGTQLPPKSQARDPGGNNHSDTNGDEISDGSLNEMNNDTNDDTDENNNDY